MFKRVALLTTMLLGAMLAFQPATASAQEVYGRHGYGDRSYSYRSDYNRERGHDRNWRRDERREHEWREHNWREHEWRDNRRPSYGGSVYFYEQAPTYGYGYSYNPRCR